MRMNNKVIVGQDVVLVDWYGKSTIQKVTKIGAKYFYIDSIKVNIETLVVEKNYGGSTKVFLSKEHYESYLLFNKQKREFLENINRISFNDENADLVNELYQTLKEKQYGK